MIFLDIKDHLGFLGRVGSLAWSITSVMVLGSRIKGVLVIELACNDLGFTLALLSGITSTCRLKTSIAGQITAFKAWLTMARIWIFSNCVAM